MPSCFYFPGWSTGSSFHAFHASMLNSNIKVFAVDMCVVSLQPQNDSRQSVL
jgi:hypothetical protein